MLRPRMAFTCSLRSLSRRSRSASCPDRTCFSCSPTPSGKSAVVQVAVELVDGGAQSIELCGAFGPVWAARVIEAVGGGVPVGSVSYSMESVPSLAALFTPAT